MNWPELKFYLIEEDFTEHEIMAPVGWEDIDVKVGRSAKWFGIFRSYSLALKFHGESAQLIRDTVIDFGFQASMIFRIKELTSIYTYTTWYEGTLDFSTFKEIGDERTIEINVLQSGISETIKAKESIVYEIDIEQGDQVEVVYDGVTIADSVAWYNYGQIIDHTPGSGNITDYLNLTYGEFKNSTKDAIQVFSVNGNEQILLCMRDCQIKVRMRMYFDWTSGAVLAGGEVQYRISKNDVSLLHTFFAHEIPVGALIEYMTFDDTTAVIDLVAGDFLKVFVYSNLMSGSDIYIDHDAMNLNIDIMAQLPQTTFQAISIKTAFQYLLAKIDSSINYSAPVLDTFEDVLMTSGDAIRQIEEPKIKLSLQDFFNFVNEQFGCALGLYVEDGTEYLYLDTKSEFYENVELANIGEVKDFEMSVANEYIFSEIRIGCESQDDYDENNGKDEFNTVFVWETHNKKRNNVLEMINPYLAGMYAIDNHRLKYMNSADNGQSGAKEDDNPTFVLSCEYSMAGEWVPKRDDFVSILGLTYPDTALNLLLSPKLSLLRSGDFIHSGLYKVESSYLDFASCDKNKSLKFKYGLLTIEEAKSEQISTLPRPLFKPFIFEFTAPFHLPLFDTLQKFPYRYITFTWNGINLQGFILDVSSRPADRNAVKWKLLCHPDITPLIES